VLVYWSDIIVYYNFLSKEVKFITHSHRSSR
jgi:hypothetical protein